MWRDENVTVATAKIEIRCGQLAVSPQVNNACSRSEGGRQTIRDRGVARESGGRGDTTVSAKTFGFGV